jgi:hypothetical protein
VINKLFELLILTMLIVHKWVLLLVDELKQLGRGFAVEVLKTVLDKAVALQVSCWPNIHV